MDVTDAIRDGAPVILLQVPIGGPPVTLDPAGWAALQSAGVTSVVAQKGTRGEHIVARAGKRQTAAARIVWGDDPPPRIVTANGDRRDLRRVNLAAEAPQCPKPAEPEVARWTAMTDQDREAAIRSMVRAGYRRMWHAERDWLIREGRYPLAHLLPPRRQRRG